MNYSMLEKIFQQDYAVKISLFVHSHRNPKTKHWVSSFREKNKSWLDSKLPYPLWFNTLATHVDREEIQ